MAVTAAVNHLLAHRNASVSGKLGSFNTENRPQEYRLGFVGDKSNEYLPVSSIRHEGRTVRVHINDKVVDVDLSAWPLDGPVVLAQLESEGKREEVIMQLISKIDLGFKIQYVGSNYDINVLSPLEADLIKHVPVLTAADSSNKVTSPMAGQLVSIAVKVGDQVAIGQEICIVEAMKMQNILRAERDGVIKAIKAEAGKPVALDQIIVEFQ
jgi:acetyl/propionyl-CoA carboxylase alpha subunit